MAFLRFSRDKRGYEHFYLVEATTNRRGKTRARVLYWFRSPPNVKVGREPFDEAVRRALESQNPGVSFDWRKIIETPVPSADAERWRDRRRAERAERAARLDAAPPAAGDVDRDVEAETDADVDSPVDDSGIDIGAEAAAMVDPLDSIEVDAPEQQAHALAPTEESIVATPMTIVDTSPGRPRRRRRRRRRGHGDPKPEL